MLKSDGTIRKSSETDRIYRNVFIITEIYTKVNILVFVIIIKLNINSNMLELKLPRKD